MALNLKEIIAAKFNERNFNQVLEIAQALLSRFPEDVSAHYCAGLSRIILGDHIKGFIHFIEIINIYKNKENIINDRDFQYFAGWSAMQLAILADFYQPAYQMRNNAFHFIDTGARAAIQIGHKIQDMELVGLGEDMLKREIIEINKHGVQVGYVKPYSPFILQIEPTNNCNLRCGMCPREVMTRKKGFIDNSLFGDILSSWENRHAELTVQNLITRNTLKFQRPGAVKLFFMGEALLHPKLCELISLARKFKCNVGIQTNGVLLKDPQLRRKLLESGLNSIGFSIDGVDKNSYEIVRNGSCWDDICRNIEELYNLRNEMGLNNQVKFAVASILNNTELGKEDKIEGFLKPLRPFIEEVSILPLDRKYKGAFVDTHGLPFTYKNALPDKVCFDQPVCNDQLKKLNVLWDGRVTPCNNDIEGHLLLGEVKDGIDAVWNNQKTLKLQRSLLSQNLDDYQFCRACISGNLNQYAVASV